METAEVIKRGETCIQVTLHRNSTGLSVSTNVHPRVEEFFKALSGNSPELLDVGAYGRHWVPTKNGGVLKAYNTQRLESGTFMMDDGSVFNIENLGVPLLSKNDNGRDNLNLGFLKLVGTSEGTGVTFEVKGVYSLEQLRKLRDKISVAAKMLYIAYMRPVDLTVQISTQELQL